MCHVAPWVMLVCAALVPSCGSGGGGSGPSEEQKTAVLSADAAGDAADQSVSTSTEVVIDSGSSGGTQSSTTSGSSINYQANLNVMVNLDAPGASGSDRYPNATGIIHVVASGTVSGTSASGSADYSVGVTAVTDCVFTNPYAGTTGTIYAGSTFTYTLDLTWSWTDSLNWTISASTNTALTSFAVGCSNGPATYSATINGSRDVSATFSRAGGTWSGSWSVTSYWTIVTPFHTVVVNVVNLSTIYITVDGVTFGPYTAAQVVAIWQCWCF